MVQTRAQYKAAIIENLDLELFLEQAALEEYDSDLLRDLDSLPLDFTGPTPTISRTLQTPKVTKTSTYKRFKKNEKKTNEREKKGYEPTERVIEIVDSADIMRLPSFDAANFQRVRTGYTGMNSKGGLPPLPKPEEDLTVEDLVAMGLKEVEWDGKIPLLIFDCKERLVAVLAGSPDDQEYGSDLNSFRNFLVNKARTYPFRSNQREHRRGNFAVLNIGISHGQGSTEPFYFSNKKDAALINEILAHPAMKRIAGFQSECMQAYCKKLAAKYREVMKALRDRKLLPPCLGSYFPTVAVNLGPQTRTNRHKDTMNLAPGFCWITCLSNHDPTRGGHIIMWEYGIFARFPNLSTAGLPSAVVTHSNLGIAKNEVRCSVTQYAAGALFRWVDNKQRIDSEIPKGERKVIIARRLAFFKIGLKLFTTVKEHLDM